MPMVQRDIHELRQVVRADRHTILGELFRWPCGPF